MEKVNKNTINRIYKSGVAPKNKKAVYAKQVAPNAK
jgi:hypothetical protein